MPLEGTPIWFHSNAGTGAGTWAFTAAELDTGNSASRVDFGTSTTAGFKPVRPGVVTPTSVAVVASPATTATGLGWNVPVADMDAATVGDSRLINAGTLVFNMAIAASTADTTTNFGLRVHVYKRLTNATFQFVAQGETIGLSAGATAQDIDVSVVLASPMVFAAGETFHVEVWMRGRGGGATGLLQQIIQFRVGGFLENQDTNVAIPGGGLRYHRPRTMPNLTAVGIVSRILRVRTTKALVAVGLPVFNRTGTLFRSFSRTAVGTAGFSRAIIAVRTFALVTTGVVARVVGVRLARAVTMVGLTTSSKKIFIVRALTTIGVPALVKKVGKTFNLVTVGTPGFNRAVIAVRSFARTMFGVSKSRIEMPEEALNRITGGSGGTTIIKKIIAIFDD